MDDVKPTALTPQEGTGETETPTSVPQQEEQTGAEQAPSQETKGGTDKSVPYSRFSEVNKRYRELQAEVNKAKQRQQLEGYEPEDTERVLQHPIVQDLLIKTAKQEVTDFARDYLIQFPEFPATIKKAILRNVRGFIKESTTDPETAKIDVQEYIDEVWEEHQTSQPKGTVKDIKVTPPNVSARQEGMGTRPAEIQAILEKPVTEWTDEEEKTVEDYTKTHK